MTAKSPTQRILVLLAALALIVGLASAAYWRSFAVTRKVPLAIAARLHFFVIARPQALGGSHAADSDMAIHDPWIATLRSQ